MSQSSDRPIPYSIDPVSNVLKWILLAVAVVSFALFAWATVLTYERAPPQPERFVGTNGALLMSNEDIVAGKAGLCGPREWVDGAKSTVRRNVSI